MTAVDNIGLAVAEHAACPHCSRPGQIWFHGKDSGARCPEVRLAEAQLMKAKQ